MLSNDCFLVEDVDVVALFDSSVNKQFYQSHKVSTLW